MSASWNAELEEAGDSADSRVREGGERGVEITKRAEGEVIIQYWDGGDEGRGGGGFNEGQRDREGEGESEINTALIQSW